MQRLFGIMTLLLLGFALGVLLTQYLVDEEAASTGTDGALGVVPEPKSAVQSRDTEATDPQPAESGAKTRMGSPGDLTAALEGLFVAAGVPPPNPRVDIVAGTISGNIRRKSGELAHAGVLVQAKAVRAREPEVARDSNDIALSERLRREYEEHLWRENAHRETRTDAHGNYTIDQLAAGALYWVEPEEEGYEFTLVGEAQALGPGGRADFVSQAVAVVTVEVVLPDGSTPAQATLRFDAAGGRQVEWSPERGRIAMRYGRYDVSAWIGDEFRSPTTNLDLNDSRRYQNLRLQLQPRAGIRGQVRLVEGEVGSLFPDLSIYYWRAVEGERMNAELLATRGTRVAPHDSTGHFRILDLTAGRYWVGVELVAAAGIEVMQAVDVGARVTPCDFDVPEFGKQNSIPLRITLPEGARPGAVNVSIEGVSDSGAGAAPSPVLRTVPRPDGSYATYLPPSIRKKLEGATAGGAALLIAVDRFPSQRFPLRTRSPEIHARFEAPATLNVRLSGHTIELAALLSLTLVPTSAEDAERHTPFIMLQNLPEQRSLGPMAPGRWTLTLDLQIGGLQETRMAQQVFGAELELKSGSNECVIELPPLYRVRIAVPGARSGMTVMLTNVDDPEQRAGFAVDEEGFAECRYLLGGEYQVDLHGPGASTGETMRVRVERDEDLTFQRQIKRQLAVVIDERSGALGRAGFQDDDLVIGIDGEFFDSEQEMLESFERAKRGGASRFMIKRGQINSDVEFDASLPADTWGGTLTPTAQ